jgi:threonine dehydratase
MITVKDISKAQLAISKYISETPLIYSNYFSTSLSRKIFFKCESFQRTGSFKIRGAINRFLHLTSEEKKRGIVTASYGNLAQAAASAGKSTDTKTTIVVPHNSSTLKTEYAKAHGAEVIVQGDIFEDTLKFAHALAEERKAVFLHPYEDPAMIAGAGTVGLEILEQNPDTEAVLVPVGGGGLLAGIATAIKEKKSKIAVIGIQTQSCSSLYKAYHSKILESSPSKEHPKTIADAINVGKVSKSNFKIIESLVDDFFVVTEEMLVSTMISLLEQGHLVVEGASAIPLAAVLEDQLPSKYRNITLVISGGNADSSLLAKIINHGLSKRNRIIRLDVIVEDEPGALDRITNILNTKHVNILQIFHNRIISESEFNRTRIQLVLECEGEDHKNELMKVLKTVGIVKELDEPSL